MVVYTISFYLQVEGNFDNVIEIVSNLNPELILTLGAGDIDRIVEPLKKALS